MSDLKSRKSGILMNALDWANNPELFWPRGKRILYVDPLDLPHLEDVKKGSMEIAKVAAIALSIFTMFPTEEALAQNTKDGERITWAIQAMEKFDVINYLINKKQSKESRPDLLEFSDIEKNILTWNILFEARGESESGQLAVLLSAYERMHSNKYPSTAEGVVFQSYQYSWTNNIPKEEFHKGNTGLLKSYLKIRELIDSFLTIDKVNTLPVQIAKLKAKISQLEKERQPNFKFPDNHIITHYHRHGMLDITKFAKEANFATKERIRSIEQAYLNGNKDVIKIGNHLFYPDKKF